MHFGDSTRVEAVKRAAEGKWIELFIEAGIDAKHLRKQNVPCPMCGGTDRFSISRNPRYEGSWLCRGCGRGDGISLIQKYRRCTFSETLSWLEARLGIQWRSEADSKLKSRSRRKDENKLDELLDRAAPINPEGPAWKYLLSRGISPATLSKARNLFEVDDEPYWDTKEEFADGTSAKRFPAMIAAVINAHGETVALHRTYLNEDGKKADVPSPRKIVGSFSGESPAIELFEFDEVLGAAEGIETALSAAELFSIPVWSLVSAGQLTKFRIPAGLKRFVVFADNDENFTGQAAAYELARSVKTNSPACIVEVIIPKEAGSDWNDVLASRKQSRTKEKDPESVPKQRTSRS